MDLSGQSTQEKGKSDLMRVRHQTGQEQSDSSKNRVSPPNNPLAPNYPTQPGGVLPPWSLVFLLAACGGGGGGGGRPQTAAPAGPTYTDPYDNYWAVGLRADYVPPSSGYARKPHPGISTILPDNIQPLSSSIPAYSRDRFDVYENHPVHKPVLDIGKLIPDANLPDGIGDNSLFRMDEAGRIFFREAPDFEAPYDHGHGSRQGRDNHYHLYIRDDVTGRFLHAEIVIHDLVSERGWREALSRPPDHDRPAYNVRRDDIRPDHQPQETTEDSPIGIQHVISGWVWAMPTSGPLVLTWSMATFLSPDARINPNKLTSTKQIETFRMLINRAFAEFEKAANLRFVEVDENDYGMGHLRFRFGSPASSDENKHRNFAYLPGQANIDTTAQFGIRLIAEEDHDTMFGVILHEIGHALGLQHTYNSGYGWSESQLKPTLPSILLNSPDRYFPAAHSATSVPYSPILTKTDIAALQYLYGAPDSNDAGIIHKLTPAARQALEQRDEGVRPPVETGVLPRGEPAIEFSLSASEVTITAPLTEQKLADVRITDDSIGVNTPFFAPNRISWEHNSEKQQPAFTTRSQMFREMLEFRFEAGQWSLWLTPVREGFADWRSTFDSVTNSVTGEAERVYALDLYLASSGGTPQEPSRILTTRLRIILDESTGTGGDGTAVASHPDASRFLAFDQPDADMQALGADIL